MIFGNVVKSGALAAAMVMAGPALAGPASDLVASIYAQPGSEFDLSLRDHFTDPARRQLDLNDEAGEAGEIGCIDFGFAYDAQDYEADEIARTLKLAETVSGDEAKVVAAFRNFDQPVEVEWTLRKVGGAWKIADVASRENDWRLGAFDCAM